MNDPSQQHIGTPALIRRFAPYLMRYKRILIFDLFCAALTTLCDIVLPKIMSYLTNAATDPGIVLTVDAVLKLALLYLILRLIDGAAQYFMSGTGHIMGVYIETDMRRDAFAHLQRLSHTYYSNTKVGQIMGRITNDLFDVTEFAHHCPEEFFNNVLEDVSYYKNYCDTHPTFENEKVVIAIDVVENVYKRCIETDDFL